MSDIVSTLRAAGCVFAEDEARMLIEATNDPAELAERVARRVAGVPLEHIVGWAEFCGLRIAVDPGVFVPRRRTKLLVREAAASVGAGTVVVDLCCGTGAVGAALLRLALAAALGPIELHAADVDPAAVRCARRNVPVVHEGDLYAALPADLRGRVDVLAVNAPYVPTDAIATMPPEARDHEARVALHGGADGLDVVRRVAAGAPGWLGPQGRLLVETSRCQAPAAAAAFAAAGLLVRVAVCDELDATVVIGCPGG